MGSLLLTEADVSRFSFAGAASLQDVASLGKHLDGCAKGFWRALGREHGESMAAAMWNGER